MDSACYGRAGLTSQPGNMCRPWFHPQQLSLGLHLEPPCPPSLDDEQLLGYGAHDPTRHHIDPRATQPGMLLDIGMTFILFVKIQPARDKIRLDKDHI